MEPSSPIVSCVCSIDYYLIPKSLKTDIILDMGDAPSLEARMKMVLELNEFWLVDTLPRAARDLLERIKKTHQQSDFLFFETSRVFYFQKRPELLQK